MLYLSLAWCFLFAFHNARVALAHGFVHSVIIDGKEYPGWSPFSDPYGNPPARVVRKILNDGFVAGTDPDISCHHEGNEGTAAIANAPAGSKVTFQWQYWPGDHQGPISTYMANCNGDCSSFSANSAKWFKIDEDGYDPSTKTWAAARLIAAGGAWTSTIPAKLAPGQYLIRNEIVALHSAGSPQFYPSCAQIKVTGTGSGTPSDDELVSFQDLYRTTVFPNIYIDSISFTVPGPAPVTFGEGGAAPRPRPSSTAGTSQQPPRASATPARPAPPGPPRPAQCRLNMGAKKLARRMH